MSFREYNKEQIRKWLRNDYMLGRDLDCKAKEELVAVEELFSLIQESENETLFSEDFFYKAIDKLKKIPSARDQYRINEALSLARERGKARSTEIPTSIS